MDRGVRTADSAGGQAGVRGRAADWLLLEGDRRVVAAGVVLGAIGVFGALVAVGLLAVGAGSSVATLFGSGVTSGVVTLLTIALSINQLILSRVFGSPGALADRLDGARELRGRVETLAGRPSSPSDPAAFLSLLATTLSDRATGGLRSARQADADLPDAVAAGLADVAAYGRSIDAQVDPASPVAGVLGVIVGPEYATNMTAVHHLRNEYGASLPQEVRAELRAVEELLESLAVVRQFFKTMALQQDFAALSRLLVYTGLAALLASVVLTLVYRAESATVAASLLRVAVPVTLGVVVAPLALFAVYILRAATVAYRTVSVGPFVPPEER